jgi:hypothetical protein
LAAGRAAAAGACFAAGFDGVASTFAVGFRSMPDRLAASDVDVVAAFGADVAFGAAAALEADPALPPASRVVTLPTLIVPRGSILGRRDGVRAERASMPASTPDSRTFFAEPSRETPA